MLTDEILDRVFERAQLDGENNDARWTAIGVAHDTERVLRQEGIDPTSPQGILRMARDVRRELGMHGSGGRPPKARPSAALTCDAPTDAIMMSPSLVEQAMALAGMSGDDYELRHRAIGICFDEARMIQRGGIIPGSNYGISLLAREIRRELGMKNIGVRQQQREEKPKPVERVPTLPGLVGMMRKRNGFT